MLNGSDRVASNLPWSHSLRMHRQCLVLNRIITHCRSLMSLIRPFCSGAVFDTDFKYVDIIDNCLLCI